MTSLSREDGEDEDRGGGSRRRIEDGGALALSATVNSVMSSGVRGRRSDRKTGVVARWVAPVVTRSDTNSSLDSTSDGPLPSVPGPESGSQLNWLLVGGAS